MVNRRPAQTRARIAQTASRLRSLIHPEAVAPDELLVSERTGRIPYADAQALSYRPAEIGEAFGPQWATYWFRLAATVPEHWAGRPVELVWDSGCEALLYRDGAPVQGLVKGGGYDRTTAPLGTPAGRVELELEMACNDLMGLPDPFPQRRDRTGRTWEHAADDRSLRAPRPPARLERAGLALVDPEAWELAWDFEALRQLVEEPGLEPAWEGRLLAELDRFARTFVGRRPRELARGAGDPRRPATRTATPAAPTTSPRSATRTSTPPGCGRWPRRGARSCARGRASSR